MKTFLRGELLTVSTRDGGLTAILAVFAEPLDNGSAVERKYIIGTLVNGVAECSETGVKMDLRDPSMFQAVTPEQIEQIKKDIEA